MAPDDSTERNRQSGVEWPQPPPIVDGGRHDIGGGVIGARGGGPRARLQRREARETIYGVLFSIAAAGSIVSDEGSILGRLAEIWGIETTTAPQEPEA